VTKNVCTGDSIGAGWHLPSSIVWNYIDSYRYNIGCSSFYCGWRWYQRFILIVFGHFRPPRNNLFYIFITWVIFECIRLISYNGNNPIIKAVPNLPIKFLQQFWSTLSAIRILTCEIPAAAKSTADCVL
jgi:hypothetical protein